MECWRTLIGNCPNPGIDMMKCSSQKIREGREIEPSVEEAQPCRMRFKTGVELLLAACCPPGRRATARDLARGGQGTGRTV